MASYQQFQQNTVRYDLRTGRYVRIYKECSHQSHRALPPESPGTLENPARRKRSSSHQSHRALFFSVKTGSHHQRLCHARSQLTHSPFPPESPGTLETRRRYSHQSHRALIEGAVGHKAEASYRESQGTLENPARRKRSLSHQSNRALWIEDVTIPTRVTGHYGSSGKGSWPGGRSRSSTSASCVGVSWFASSWGGSFFVLIGGLRLTPGMLNEAP